MVECLSWVWEVMGLILGNFKTILAHWDNPILIEKSLFLWWPTFTIYYITVKKLFRPATWGGFPGYLKIQTRRSFNFLTSVGQCHLVQNPGLWQRWIKIEWRRKMKGRKLFMRSLPKEKQLMSPVLNKARCQSWKRCVRLCSVCPQHANISRTVGTQCIVNTE